MSALNVEGCPNPCISLLTEASGRYRSRFCIESFLIASYQHLARKDRQECLSYLKCLMNAASAMYTVNSQMSVT